MVKGFAITVGCELDRVEQMPRREI